MCIYIYIERERDLFAIRKPHCQEAARRHRSRGRPPWPRLVSDDCPRGLEGAVGLDPRHSTSMT